MAPAPVESVVSGDLEVTAPSPSGPPKHMLDNVEGVLSPSQANARFASMAVQSAAKGGREVRAQHFSIENQQKIIILLRLDPQV